MAHTLCHRTAREGRMKGGRPRLLGTDTALEALRDLARRLGHSPTTEELVRDRLTPSDGFYVRRFGSLAAAYRKAGLERRPPGGQIIHGRRKETAYSIDPEKARQITEAKKAYWRRSA